MDDIPRGQLVKGEGDTELRLMSRNAGCNPPIEFVPLAVRQWEQNWKG